MAFHERDRAHARTASAASPSDIERPDTDWRAEMPRSADSFARSAADEAKFYKNLFISDRRYSIANQSLPGTFHGARSQGADNLVR
jgi:hypothetical protein